MMCVILTFFDQATRRDLMPGHVHTLGILKHSRSRHDRNQRGGIEDDDCLLGDNEELSYNPTGDPLLDAKMLQVVIRFSTKLNETQPKL